MLTHAGTGFFQVRHARPQFPFNATALFFTHLIEAGQGLFHFGQYSGFQFAIGWQGAGVQSPG